VTPLYAATGEIEAKNFYERVSVKKESPDPSEQKMKLVDGKLSARFVATPLKQVMAKFGQLCDVEILWSGQELEEPISVWFTDKAPDKAVQEILAGRSYVLAYKSVNNEGTLAKVSILDSSSENSTIEPLFEHSYQRVKSDGRQVRQYSAKNTWSNRRFDENRENEEYAHIDNMGSRIESMADHSRSLTLRSARVERDQSESMPLDMLIEMADEQKRAMRMQREKYPGLKKRRISDASKTLQNFIGGVR
jgi:hypothetical protein